ncbi:MAG: hypothetical protein AAE977_02815 [Thermoplasmataceae archaeon]|jgi:hypothetical protein
MMSRIAAIIIRILAKLNPIIKRIANISGIIDMNAIATANALPKVTVNRLVPRPTATNTIELRICKMPSNRTPSGLSI